MASNGVDVEPDRAGGLHRARPLIHHAAVAKRVTQLQAAGGGEEDRADEEDDADDEVGMIDASRASTEHEQHDPIMNRTAVDEVVSWVAT